MQLIIKISKCNATIPDNTDTLMRIQDEDYDNYSDYQNKLKQVIYYDAIGMYIELKNRFLQELQSNEISQHEFKINYIEDWIKRYFKKENGVFIRNFGGQTIKDFTSLWWKAEGQKESSQETLYNDPEPEFHYDFDYYESDNDQWEDDVDRSE